MFLVLISSLILSLPENILDIISIILNFEGLEYFLVNDLCALRRICILLVLGVSYIKLVNCVVQVPCILTGFLFFCSVNYH